MFAKNKQQENPELHFYENSALILLIKTILKWDKNLYLFKFDQRRKLNDQQNNLILKLNLSKHSHFLVCCALRLSSMS